MTVHIPVPEDGSHERKEWKSEEYWIGLETSNNEERIRKWASKSLPKNGYTITCYTVVIDDDYADVFISFTEEKYQTLFLLAFGDTT